MLRIFAISLCTALALSGCSNPEGDRAEQVETIIASAPDPQSPVGGCATYALGFEDLFPHIEAISTPLMDRVVPARLSKGPTWQAAVEADEGIAAMDTAIVGLVSALVGFADEVDAHNGRCTRAPRSTNASQRGPAKVCWNSS